MRAEEFITDAINKEVFTPGWTDETTILNRYVLKAKATDDWNKYQKLDIDVFDPESGIPYRIAHARFRIKPGFFFQKNLQASMIHVHDEYQKRGIATAIYQYVRKLGNTIKPSPFQLGPGKEMWKSFNRTGAIAEAFNAPYPMTWEHGDGSHDALVKLPDGTNLSIMFSVEYGDYGNEEWQVEFWRNNSQDVTGEGDAQRIFATVLSAIQEFIKTENPERIRFSASKETDAGDRNASRSSLYTSLVKRYARSWGYDVDVSDYAGSTVYELDRLQ